MPLCEARASDSLPGPVRRSGVCLPCEPATVLSNTNFRGARSRKLHARRHAHHHAALTRTSSIISADRPPPGPPATESDASPPPRPRSTCPIPLDGTVRARKHRGIGSRHDASIRTVSRSLIEGKMRECDFGTTPCVFPSAASRLWPCVSHSVTRETAGPVWLPVGLGDVSSVQT